MALTTLQQDHISRCAQKARQLIDEMKVLFDEMAYFWDGAPNWHASVTDGDLAAVPGFNGMTATQLADGLYPLIGAIKTALTDSYQSLAILAALAGR